MYQYHTLEEVGRILEKNAQGMSPNIMLRRLIRFCEHLQKEEHFHPEEHEQNLESLEKQFHANNGGPPETFISLYALLLVENLLLRKNYLLRV